MHTAQRSLHGAERIVHLDKPGHQTLAAELTLAEGPGEETTSSPRFSRSIRYAPLRGVSVKIIGLFLTFLAN